MPDTDNAPTAEAADGARAFRREPIDDPAKYVHCYLGEIDGQPVTTGMGITLGAFVGVFSIATPPAHRRRGYGAAVTVRAIADGLAAGAKWSWLQSTPRRLCDLRQARLPDRRNLAMLGCLRLNTT